MRAVSLPGVFPQGYVSGLQAHAACEASGKRLCSSRVEERVHGPPEDTFPYGNERQTGQVPTTTVGAVIRFNPQLMINRSTDGCGVPVGT